MKEMSKELIDHKPNNAYCDCLTCRNLTPYQIRQFWGVAIENCSMVLARNIYLRRQLTEARQEAEAIAYELAELRPAYKVLEKQLADLKAKLAEADEAVGIADRAMQTSEQDLHDTKAELGAMKEWTEKARPTPERCNKLFNICALPAVYQGCILPKNHGGPCLKQERRKGGHD